jgi:predicted RNase H-like HicB family nuclease
MINLCIVVCKKRGRINQWDARIKYMEYCNEAGNTKQEAIKALTSRYPVLKYCEIEEVKVNG